MVGIYLWRAQGPHLYIFNGPNEILDVPPVEYITNYPILRIHRASGKISQGPQNFQGLSSSTRYHRPETLDVFYDFWTWAFWRTLVMS